MQLSIPVHSPVRTHIRDEYKKSTDNSYNFYSNMALDLLVFEKDVEDVGLVMKALSIFKRLD